MILSCLGTLKIVYVLFNIYIDISGVPGIGKTLSVNKAIESY